MHFSLPALVCIVMLQGVQCAFTYIVRFCIAVLQEVHRCAKCNLSSLHNYIALVAGTVTKEAVDVHFKAPCLSLGQSLNVHFKPDGGRIVDHSYEEHCLVSAVQ